MLTWVVGEVLGWRTQGEDIENEYISFATLEDDSDCT